MRGLLSFLLRLLALINVILHDVGFFFSSRRRHTRCSRDWSSDVCSSDLIVADAANQAVTGWPRTTLAPHPIMMTATASVTRRSQRTWLVIVVNECIETSISNSLRSRRWKARNGWRVAPHDGRPRAIRPGPAPDLVFTGEPDARL